MTGSRVWLVVSVAVMAAGPAGPRPWPPLSTIDDVAIDYPRASDRPIDAAAPDDRRPRSSIAESSIVDFGMLQPDDLEGTLPVTRARMYRASSAAVWRAVPDALKAVNLVTPQLVAASQLAVAWQMMPMGPRERKSELRVFVSPFAEPARVYVGSIVRTPAPDDSRLLVVRYNTGEMEEAFFAALEKIVRESGQPIPRNVARRAAAARALLGDAGPCLTRLEADEPPDLGADGGVAAPLKIVESDVIAAVPAGKLRDKIGREARIDATVSEDGAILGARLIRTAVTDQTFETAVLGAASLWHYRPAKADGCYVPVRMTLAVQSGR